MYCFGAGAGAAGRDPVVHRYAPEAAQDAVTDPLPACLQAAGDAGGYAALAGGIVAIIILILKGELWKTLRNIFRFIRSVIIPKLEPEPLSKKYPMPYAVVIALGTLAAYYLPPFISW